MILSFVDADAAMDVVPWTSQSSCAYIHNQRIDKCLHFVRDMTENDKKVLEIAMQG